jgi:MoaA/NifB/PqqE/SkfB family radical SAM enzyme
MSNMMFDGSVKILAHPELLDAHKRHELRPPVTVEIDLTNYCAHKCPLCVGGRTNMVKMHGTAARSLLDDLCAYGVRAIVFTRGGEPTSHPDIVSLVTHTRRLGMDVGLITNGGIIAHDQAMAAAVVRDCEWVRVSIDAGDPDTYRLTHGVDQFEDVWHAVRLLGDAAKRDPSPATVGVGYLIGEKTLDGMVAATERAATRGANYIQFRPFIEEAATICVERVGGIVHQCRSFEHPNFHVGYLNHKYTGERMQHRPYNSCHGSCFTAVIQADGNVPLCCLYRGQPDYYGGCVFEAPFPTIWTGERMAELRAINVHQCPPLCRHDTLNELVELILQPKPHSNFL